VRATAAKSEALTEKDLANWRPLPRFQRVLDKVLLGEKVDATFSDPRRRAQLGDYLSLYLFALLNPVVRTMRGACEASLLPRVQREVCARAISLGSFSETQHVIDPALLEKVFGELVQEVPGHELRDKHLEAWRWMARDGSLFRALPRMAWATYGGGKAGHDNHAVRLHLNFFVFDEKPCRAQVRPGAVCERKTWQQQCQPGDAYIGDRYFGEDYKLFWKLHHQGCVYVVRLREKAVINVEEELALSQEDRQAGVVRQAWAHLGAKERYRSMRVRVVWIQSAEHSLILVSNLTPEQVSAAEVGLLYLKRWKVELFFRWIKCVLGCRHWLAESPRGVTIQLYLALIAALLLQLYTGRRPTRRMMELIQLYLLGYATAEDVAAGLQRELKRLRQRQKA
jgi:hypothetical protein